MKQPTRRALWAASLLGLSTFGAVVAACTSNGADGGDDQLPVPTASATGTGTTGRDGSTTPQVDGGGGGEDGGGGDAGDCSKAPVLRAPGTGPYCPFQALDGGADGGRPPSNCEKGDVCCAPMFVQGGTTPASFCKDVPNYQEGQCGFNANGGLEWHCADESHCGAGSVCCMIGNDAGLPEVVSDLDFPKSCNALRGRRIGGTRCVQGSACNSGSIKLCSTDAQCANGQKCTAFGTNARDLGYCR